MSLMHHIKAAEMLCSGQREYGTAAAADQSLLLKHLKLVVK